MKNLRQLCAAVVLTFVLTLSVPAGQITTGITDPPPPPASTTIDGQITTGTAEPMQTGGDEGLAPVTQIALNVLQSMLSLF
jgi:hypothetical protein